MNPDTAEIPAIEPALGAIDAEAPRVAEPVARPAAGAVWLAELRADPQRMLAVRESWRALWASRALVWIAGVGSLLVFGFGPVRRAFNPPGVTRGFGALGDLLAGPAARWDSAWYLVIAHYGYRPELGALTSSRAAFFPLYPLGLRAIAEVGLPPILAGVLLSLLALALALYGIHRLTTLELAGRLGRGLGDKAVPGGATLDAAHAEVARYAVLLMAFAPMAFFLSAVYSEALYLALSVGVFWSARNGRWAAACALGALAAATRSAGIVLALPVLMLYLYGPREDRAPDFPAARGLRPRYRVRSDALWLALIPLGVALYMAYLALDGGDALMPFHAQELWSRHFVGPYLGVWDGARAAFAGLRQLLSMQSHHVYFPAASGSPTVSAGHNLLLFASLLAGLAGLVGVLRRLPLAYGAYILAALAMPLSYPVSFQPLMSLPRFLLVLFPLGMWFAAWLVERPRAARVGVLVVSAALMAFFVAEFTTWHWVA